MKSRSFSGATAVSSTKEIDLASSFIAMERPSAASRRLQTRACCAGIGRVMVSDSRSRARVRSASRAASRGGRSSFAIGVELDAQQRAGIALDERLANALQIRALAGVVEDGFVHHFDRRGIVAQDHGRGCQRFQQVRGTAPPARPSAFGSGTRFSFASSMTPSVPSEPTIIFARLTGSRPGTNSSRL